MVSGDCCSDTECDSLEQLRATILKLTKATAKADCAQSILVGLNNEAVAHLKKGEQLEAVVTFHKLFRRLEKKHLTHAELHTCYNNRAAAFLHLQLYDEALQDAEKARKLAEAALKRTNKAFGPYVKSFSRKAHALIGLQRYREAALAADQGLKLDPFNLELRKASEEVTQGTLKDLLTGKGREILALPSAEPTQRITYHAHSAPLHKIKTDNLLPNVLLTPFQAESDHHVRDSYNFMTVQTDIAMPKQQIKIAEDTVRQSAWAAAIRDAVTNIMAQDMDCRVLDLGAGSGLHAMTALDAGAHHVTAVERWLYLSLTCKETLKVNGFDEERFKVIYKRPTDLCLQEDVPILCNLLLCDILDEGLLASGIIPVVKHCLDNLLTTNARAIPASATVYAQAVEMRITDVCGLDMSSMNRHRWHPGHTAGIPLADNAFIPLTEAMDVWHFDMLSPPEESHRKTLDLTFIRDGKFNAVVFWYKLQLTPEIILSTAPGKLGSGMQSLGPAVQYLAGELPVEQGAVLPLLASHNTVRMRFDIQEAEYLHLAKPDAAFPPSHFAMLADHGRNQAYQAALARVIKKKKSSAGSAHVVDLGTGSGLLAVMAAKAGADTVVACDLHGSLCNTARKVVAANGVASSVSVVHRDVGLLQRGREVQALGANIAVADMFDAGLIGHNFLAILEMAKKNVLQPGAVVVPCAASLYVMGIHVPSPQAGSYDLSALEKYRWDKSYEACQLDELTHTRLTKPCKAFEYFFEGERKGRGRDNMVKLEVIAEGRMNAVAFWFDLHLDQEESICSGPSYVALGGAIRSTEQPPVVQSANRQATKAAASSTAAVHKSDGATAFDITSISAPGDTAMSFSQDADNAAAVALKSIPNSSQTDSNASLAAINRHASMDAASKDAYAAFLAATAFAGAKSGMVFKHGSQGQGYYLDETHAEVPLACKAISNLGGKASYSDVNGTDLTDHAPASPDAVAANNTALPTCNLSPISRGDSKIRCRKTHISGDEDLQSGEEGEQARASQHKAEGGDQTEGKGCSVTAHSSSQTGHYWGQGLQFLDCHVQVMPGRKPMLLARRDGAEIRFSLRAGAGSPVDRAPWKEEWGGGASVENPHFQRVHYCDLLVQDFLTRVRSKRFPSIEEDMKMLQAHCGSLLLDPAVLARVYHEMVVLEQMHAMPDFSSAASMQAISSPALLLH